MVKKIWVVMTLLLMTIIGVNAFDNSNVLMYYSFDTGLNDLTSKIPNIEGGTYTLTNGKIGNALTLDGSNSLYIPYSNLLQEPATISVWFKLNDINNDYTILSSTKVYVADYLMVRYIGGINAHYMVVGNNNYIDYASPKDTNWHNIVIAWDNTDATWEYYFDGILVTTQPYSVSPQNPYNLRLGGISDGNDEWVEPHRLNGQIDELVLFNTAFNSNDVKKLYNSGNGLQYPFNYEGKLSDYVTGYWDMNEVSGDVVSNSVSNGVNGVNFNTLIQTGKIGNSRYNDGTDGNYISLDNNICNFGNNDFSIGAWVKYGGTSLIWDNVAIIGNEKNDWNYEGFMIDIIGTADYFNQGKLRFLTQDNNAQGSTIMTSRNDIFLDGNWHYVVASREGTLHSLYVDGVLETSQNLPIRNSDFAGTTCKLMGNGDQNPYSFYGNVDEVSIWSKGLNQNEVSYLYNGGNGNSYNEISNYYLVTEGVNDATTIGYGVGIDEMEAQSFKVLRDNYKLNSVTIQAYQWGSFVDDTKVEIQADNNGLPSGTPINQNAISILDSALFPYSYGDVTFNFNQPLNLINGQTYWLVFSRTGDFNNNGGTALRLNSISNDYLAGSMLVKRGVWENQNYDISMHFIVSNNILGCTNSSALNYNATANYDDGSCSYQVAENPVNPNNNLVFSQSVKTTTDAFVGFFDAITPSFTSIMITFTLLVMVIGIAVVIGNVIKSKLK